MTYPAAVVHTSILASSAKVVAFLSDVENWKTWAPWIRSVAKASTHDWTLETDAGVMTMTFVEPNAFGILDHEVALESGVSVRNSLRVVANGAGSELVMVLFQWPHMSAEDFERDIRAVTDDFARLKTAAERV